ncbi:MAG: MFS transporter [Robiginitomaculum sp.]|nr:MAG: MFS transporter [Robiginitomaculum sp.]
MSSQNTARIAGRATGLALLIPMTLSTMAIVLLAPILPKLMEEFRDVPNYQYLVPMILTIPALCVAILSPVAGALGDYFGRRKLLISAMAVYGVVGLAPLFLQSLTSILISRIGVGISEAIIMTLSTTLIADFFKGGNRSKWLAGQTAVASVSATCFFILGGYLGQFGWRMPFVIYSTAFLMLIAVLVFTWEIEEEKGEDGEVHQLQSASWTGFPWKHMLGVVLVTVFASVLFYTVQIQSAPGLVSHGITDSFKIGWMSALASIGVPLGTFIYSRNAKRPIELLLLIEFSLLAVGFVVMSNAPSAWGFLGGCALNQIGAGMLLPTLLVWAVTGLSFEFRGRGTGIWQGVFALGQWLSPIVITLLSLRFGGLISSFQFLGYASAIAAILAVVLLWKTSKTVNAA